MTTREPGYYRCTGSVRLHKIKGIPVATEPTGSIYEGELCHAIQLGSPIRLLWREGRKWLRTSPVTSISHGKTLTTIRTMHSTYTIKAIK